MSEALLRPPGYPRADTTAVALWPRAVTVTASAYAIVGGLVTLFGWAADLPRLTGWKGDGISMFPNTALCVIASGLALMLDNRPEPRWRVLARGAALLVAAIGGLTLLQHVLGVNLGIDTLLFDRPWGQMAAASPMRMGPPASISFLALGTALFLSGSNARARRSAAVLGVLVGTIALVSFIGHLYGAQQMYTIPRLTGIAMQTASMILALSIGLVASIPDHEPMQTIVEGSAAGMLARRALPVIIVLAIALGGIRVAIQNMGLVDTAFGTALRTVTEIVLLISLLWWAVAMIRAYETALRRTEGEVLQQAERERRLHQEAGIANAQFRAFFDQGPLFAGIMEIDGTLLEVNRLALDASGFTREEVVGKLFWDTPWWTPWPALVEQIRAGCTVAAGGSAFHAELPYFVADGRQRMVDVQILPVTDRDGRILFLAPTGTDVTERRRLEQDLRQLAENLSQADRRKDEFLATLAHELRNPLAPVRNALQVLALGNDDAPRIGSLVAIMDRQIGHMVRLIDDLLDVSRVSRGKIELRAQPLELAAVIQHAVEAVRPLCDAAQQALIVTLPAEPLFLHGDPVRLTQIFGNLLNNASKYTGAGGHIAISAERRGARVVVRVRDNGIGIAADQLASVFDMFMQADTSLERAQSGLGIGLTLVKKLVEMHDGSVTARSEGLRRGSEFIVELPLLAGLPAASSATGASANLAPMAAQRVLIVDDNHDAAESLATLLQLAGHETRVAFDGAAALEAAEAFRPAVTLLDIGLPKLNGYEVARRIRAQPWGATMVLIALTGWGQDEDRQKSTEAGFDAHMVKPVEYDALTTLFAQLLEQRT